MARRPDEARREALLDQLEKIILTEGFSSLRIGDLAKRLHCSRTTLYRLAPTKNDLVLRVYHRMAERSINSCQLAAEACETPVQQIRAYLEAAHAAESETSDAFSRDVLAWPPTAAARVNTYRRGMDGVKRYIERGIQEGVFRKVNADFVAYLGWVGTLAIRNRDFLDSTDLNSQDAMGHLGDFIISSLAVR